MLMSRLPALIVHSFTSARLFSALAPFAPLREIVFIRSIFFIAPRRQARKENFCRHHTRLAALWERIDSDSEHRSELLPRFHEP